MTVLGQRVLQLEFDGVPRGANFAALRELMTTASVARIDPVALNTSAGQFTDLASRADRALASGAPAEGSPLVVQAYCTAIGLAATLTRRLVDAGREVRLVQLFDPESATDDHVADSYGELAVKLGRSPEEARREADRVMAGEDGRPAQLKALRQGLTEAGADFARTLGIAEDDAAAFGGELIDRCSAWLNHLLASIDAEYRFPDDTEIRVYQTRDCPVTGQLREVRPDIHVRTFTTDTPPMTCPELLRSALTDLSRD